MRRLRDERALDIVGSITPAAWRMASAAESLCCYAEADPLLAELAEVNFAAKRIERTTHGLPIGSGCAETRDS